MRNFIERALEKLPKLNNEQIKSLIYLLLREHERFEEVLDSLYDGIIVTDTSHRIMMINKTAFRLLSLSSDEHEYRLVWSIIADKEIAVWVESSLQGEDRVVDEEFYIEKSASLGIRSLSIFPLVKEKQVAGSIILVRDVTEKKKQEAKYRRAENLASLTTLAAGVAHEIKNPLASIGIHLQLMRREMEQQHALTEEHAVSYLDVLEEEIERLNSIVVDFLFAVRPMDTRMKREHIHEVISDLLEFIKYELAEHHITVERELADNIPKVEMDQKYIKQALLNIIKNAIAAMHDGGKLRIVTYLQGAMVGIDIIDDGVGISDELMSKIFEPYYTTKDFGSGLGLTVVYKVIKEHQGDITVDSAEGRGTKFTIYLPLPKDRQQLISWEEKP